MMFAWPSRPATTRLVPTGAGGRWTRSIVLAAMGCPNLPYHGEPGDPSAGSPIGVLFIAERDSGARMMPLFEAIADDAGEPITAATPATTAEARYAESVEAAHSNQSDAARIGAALGITAEPVRLDSQTKYAMVARGDASIYLRVPRGDYRENIWDHAAGLLIVEEAGGRVSDVEGRPFDITTGQRMTDNRGAVVAAASIHDEVVAAVRGVLEGYLSAEQSATRGYRPRARSAPRRPSIPRPCPRDRAHR